MRTWQESCPDQQPHWFDFKPTQLFYQSNPHLSECVLFSLPSLRALTPWTCCFWFANGWKPPRAMPSAQGFYPASMLSQCSFQRGIRAAQALLFTCGWSLPSLSFHGLSKPLVRLQTSKRERQRPSLLAMTMPPSEGESLKQKECERSALPPALF